MLRLYWIISIVALIGPLSVLVGYILFCAIMGGVPVPGTIGIVYILGVLIRIFPLIASPLAIGVALFLKFRYDIELIWPLKTAVLCYAIYLYHVIEYKVLF